MTNKKSIKKKLITAQNKPLKQNHQLKPRIVNQLRLVTNHIDRTKIKITQKKVKAKAS